MKGRTLVIVSLACLAGFAVALWWFQTRAFYEEYSTSTIRIGNADVPVTNFRGIDSNSSPIKLRACMNVAPSEFVEADLAQNPVPLVAPSWFECFDAKTLSRALEAEEAKAFLAASEEFHGTERIVAVFPDGRAFMWRQLTKEFADQ